MLFVIMLSLVPSGMVNALKQPSFKYHDQEELAFFLKSVAEEYSNIAHLETIGKSVEDRDLLVLILSSSPDKHVELKPDINLIGTVHGNEPTGREILIHFIYFLVVNYETNPRVKTLLDSASLQILVSMNPDGFSRSSEGSCRPQIVQGKLNVNGFDLNRNFPDFFVADDEPRQPETIGVMKWADNNNFILHANIHGGAMVVNYHYDNYIGGAGKLNQGASAQLSMSRDDDVLRYVSLEYTKNHPRIKDVKLCSYPETAENVTNVFDAGVTNGAEWYPVSGSMQDWFYIEKGAVAVTLEISCCKHPVATELQRYYSENQDPLLDFCETSFKGVRGIVKDSEGQAVAGVLVTIIGRDHPRETTNLGEYWRILLQGTYKIRFSKSCYKSVEVVVDVPETDHVRKDVILERVDVSSGADQHKKFASLLVLWITLVIMTLQSLSLAQ